MALNDEVLIKIKEEITNDPFGVGYAGKTDDEIQDLLNKPVYKQRIVVDTETAPIARILAGIANLPNVIALQDVVDAKK